MFSQKPIVFILFLLTLGFYLLIGFGLQRYDTSLLLTSYCILFGIYCWILFSADENQITFWLYAAILLRASLFFAIPMLSDDFYRFIWDGRLLASGYHPFAQVPSYYVENNISVPGIDQSLYSKLNSKNYFTIYPPVAQFIFWISATCSSSIHGSLLVMKLLVLLSEIGSIVLICKILDHFKLPSARILIYALNPLVILELMGNVHLEAVMIFFFLLSFHFLVRGKLLPAAFMFAISICVKLIPILFLPALLPLLGSKKASVFYLVAAVVSLILFLPLWDLDMIAGYQNSIGYYFSRFEFNASIYYVVRALGYLLFEYNIIQPAGWILGVVAGILMLVISTGWSRSHRPWLFKDVKRGAAEGDTRFLVCFYSIMWSLLIYFLFATTLHPWYITTLLVLSIFTDFKFVILWTGVIFLTYAGYEREGFDENLWITAVEYSAVMGYLAYELIKKKNLALMAGSAVVSACKH
jgi:hypothetical protein